MSSRKIRLAFNSHGLGDVVHAATAMRLYIKQGYDVQIQVEPNKRWVWQAAGIPVYDGEKQLPIHPYHYPDAFFDLSKPDHLQSKIAHLFEVAELPRLGTKEEVWRMVCDEHQTFSPGSVIRPEVMGEVSDFLAGLPTPIVLLHSKGTNWQAEKSIPDGTAFQLILDLVGSFGGSVITLDWDGRSPTLAHPRVKPIYPHWDHMSTEHFAALCSRADLFIGVDSGPFHLAQWFVRQSLFVARDIPPVRCCLPSFKTVYLVAKSQHEHWAARDSDWLFAEFDGPEATSRDIVLTALSMLDRPEKAIMTKLKPHLIPGIYTYYRVGYDKRPMELLEDGKIGQGSAGCERVWAIEDTPVGQVVTIYGDHGGPTCHLKLGDDGILRGRWLNHERMPIELIPDPARKTPEVVTARYEDLQAADRPRITILMTTIGRPTLPRALAAVKRQELLADDEVLLVNDGPANPFVEASWKAAGLPGRIVNLNQGPHGDHGHTPRNMALPFVSGGYVIHLDDDDESANGIVATVRESIEASPGSFFVFSALWPSGLTRWETKSITEGNVGTSMFVHPAGIPLGKFGNHYCGDFEFISQTVALNPDREIVWRSEVIVNIRPPVESSAPSVIGAHPSDSKSDAPVEFYVGIPTYICFDLLEQCIEAVLRSDWLPHRIYVIDNSQGKCPKFNSRRVEIFTPPRNLGAGGAWNFLYPAILPHQLIMLNDDIEIAPDLLRSMLQADGGVVVADGSSAFTACMIRQVAWDKVGPLDPVFWPAYYEDCDWAYRAKLAGIPFVCPPSGGFKNNGPSATKARMNEADRNLIDRHYGINTGYYIRKWGGMPHLESYTVPFNGVASP